MAKSELPTARVVNDLGKSMIVATPTGLKLIEELAERGCNVVTIAKALGVDKETFRHMRERDTAVGEAFEAGRAAEHDRLVSNLNTAAASGNVVAAIFLLKSRFGYREGEAVDVQVTVNPGGVLVVPAEVTMEQWIAEHQEAGDVPAGVTTSEWLAKRRAEAVRDVTPAPLPEATRRGD